MFRVLDVPWYHADMKTHVLKLEATDEKAEIRFDLEFLATLTREQRVRLVLDRSRLLMEMLARNGHPIVPGVSKRA